MLGEIALDAQLRVDRQAGIVQGIQIALVAILRVFLSERAGDMRNTAMPKIDQVAGRIIAAERIEIFEATFRRP